jgi:hypothetical protein
MRITSLLTAYCLLLTSACALTDTWAVDVRQHTAVQRTYKQGESWTMRVTLRHGLRPLDLTGATAIFYWYTNTAQNVWWDRPAEITSPKAGLVTAQWTPAMDTGAASYPYWIGVWASGSTSPLWRVTGTIRVLPSPGFTPNTLPLPARSIDFSEISITNAPWATPADLQAASNALAGAAQWPPDATGAEYFSYFTNDSGGLSITSYDTAGGLAVKVPDYIRGRPVEKLWSHSFASNAVTSVSGGGRLLGLGPKAFHRCYSLQTVALPAAGYIGSLAFEVCTNLSAAALPGAGQVDRSAFLGCTRLESADLGAVTSILAKAFSNCASLRSVRFSGDAPYAGTRIYESIPAGQVTNYIINPAAQGWGGTLGGMPVVRAALHADEFYRRGLPLATSAQVSNIVGEAVLNITAPAILRGGVWYRQAWDTNLQTTVWEPSP